MDAKDLYNLFTEQKELKKYVTKDVVTDDPDGRQGAHATNITFTCKTFTSQLLQWGEGFLIFKGHLERAGAGNWADDVVMGIQSGPNTLFTSVKVSMNDTEAEHNRRADLGTFVNLLEYSPDYASSIGTESGIARDTVTTPEDGTTRTIAQELQFLGRLIMELTRSHCTAMSLLKIYHSFQKAELHDKQPKVSATA